MKTKMLLAAVAMSTLAAGMSHADQLLIMHLDFNTIQMRKDAVIDCLRNGAKAGYNAVLWEVEDKIRWESCPSCVHPEAFTKAEFREILAEAARLKLEPIPLMQTVGHAEYVLRCSEYAGWMEQGDFPACYCVSRPEVRLFLKRLLHEYLELFGPSVRRFHLGGDEAIVFGTCPTCRTRDKMELYAEHLDAVSEELVAKGIRPGVWSDAALVGCDWERSVDAKPEPGTIRKLSTRYTMWNWDYSFGLVLSEEERLKARTRLCHTKLLTDLGYEVIVCGASQSYRDSPFLPFYSRHRDNLAFCAELARGQKLGGLCVTSWSVHLSPKELQYPLWDFAAKRFLNPGKSVEEDFASAVRSRLGEVDLEALCELSTGSLEFPPFDARSWNYLKLARPAKAGELKRRFENGVRVEGEGYKAKLALLARERAAAVASALEKLRSKPHAAALEPFLEGGELTLRILDAIAAAAEGRSVGPLPIERTEAFYLRFQMPQSARNAAAIVWSILQDAESVR